MGNIKKLVIGYSIAQLFCIAGCLYGAAAPEIKSTKVIVKNNSGGPINVKLNYYPNVTSPEKRIGDYEYIEFSVQYPPLTLHVESAKKTESYWYYNNVDLIGEYLKKYTPLRDDENMVVNITSAALKGYVVAVGRAPKATHAISLAYIVDPWSVFLGLNELLKTYSLANIKAEFKSKTPTPLQERIARIILNLPSNYKKTDLNSNYRALWLKYHPDKVMPEDREKAKAISNIFTKAKEILEKSDYYKHLQ